MGVLRDATQAMSITTLSLGRETPFQLQNLPGKRGLMVTFRDALCRFHQTSDGTFETAAQHLAPLTASCLLLDSDNITIVAAGPENLQLLDHDLNLITSTPLSGDEVISTVPVSSHHFLTVTDTFAVTCWEFNQTLQTAGQWTVECLPLCAVKNGKVVLASERGRVQERDVKTGMVLKTWPKTPPISWAGVAQSSEQAVLVTEDGEASCWDLSATEQLFTFALDFLVIRAVFHQTGLKGALVGADGEVALFRVTDGGETTAVETPPTPIVSVCFMGDELTGLDENGTLWKLDSQEPVALGGEWAGWVTTCLASAQETHIVGTADGRLEFFDLQGKRLGNGLQVHFDAVLGVLNFQDTVLSVGADASVYRISGWEQNAPLAKELVGFPGHSVVGYCLDESQSGHLWLALDEGLLQKISLADPEQTESIRLEGYRTEELKSATGGGIYAITDKGSVKYLK